MFESNPAAGRRMGSVTTVRQSREKRKERWDRDADLHSGKRVNIHQRFR